MCACLCAFHCLAGASSVQWQCLHECQFGAQLRAQGIGCRRGHGTHQHQVRVCTGVCVRACVPVCECEDAFVSDLVRMEGTRCGSVAVCECGRHLATCFYSFARVLKRKAFHVFYHRNLVFSYPTVYICRYTIFIKIYILLFSICVHIDHSLIRELYFRKFYYGIASVRTMAQSFSIDMEWLIKLALVSISDKTQFGSPDWNWSGFPTKVSLVVLAGTG
jgi:hypothetical protein